MRQCYHLHHNELLLDKCSSPLLSSGFQHLTVSSIDRLTSHNTRAGEPTPGTRWLPSVTPLAHTTQDPLATSRSISG